MTQYEEVTPHTGGHGYRQNDRHGPCKPRHGDAGRGGECLPGPRRNRPKGPGTEVQNDPLVAAMIGQKETASTGETVRERHRQILDAVRESLPQIQDMQPVAALSGEEFQKTASDIRSLRTKVIEFFNSIGNKVTRPGMGDIALNVAGARDSTAHGYGRLKAATFAALPSVLENGTLVETRGPYEGHDYNSYLIAAPVTVGGDTCYVGALVI